MLDARRGLGDGAHLVERGAGALQRGAVGQLHADQQVALVLVGNEGVGQARDAPAAEAGQDEGEQHHQAGVPHHAADQPA